MPHVRTQAMPDLPAGTITFLFTDIEGSTALEAVTEVLAIANKVIAELRA